MSFQVSNPSEVGKTEALSIYAIVVLQDQTPHESISLNTLSDAISRAKRESPGSLKVHVLVYDGTPRPPKEYGIEGVEYYSSHNNSIDEAYNFACLQAREGGFEWLLTLDQHSRLPEDFLVAAAAHLRPIRNHPQVAALVPRISYQGRFCSPFQLNLRGTRTPRFSAGSEGIWDGVYALNTGAIFRLSALRQINDYDARFPLDFSSTVLFHRLAAYGKRVLIAGDIQIERDSDMKSNMRCLSPERYQSLMEAESAFCDLYLGKLASANCNLRLLAQTLLHIGTGKRSLGAIAGRTLLARLFRSKRYRLQHWQSKHGAMVSKATTSCPKLSVCMTTYNGELYVEEQIRSILPQIGTEDELIIVDDHSKDQTVEKIMSFQCDQICLIRHTQNAGAVESFEEAIRSATGDILFLSDMDDVWSPHKVRKVRDVFDSQPDITIVATATALIDENGNPLEGPTARSQQSRFKPGVVANLIQNRFQGSTMAFRSRLLPFILPIPAKKLFFHDSWIGLQNAAHGGRVAFLPDALLFYRRHGSNLSGKYSRIKQIRVRAQLGWAFANSLLFKIVPSATLRSSDPASQER